MNAAPEVSIVMPCLDEAETIGGCIDDARRWLEAEGVAGEIVIGDNGSVDASAAIARARGARVVEVRERGYGSALWFACRAARGRFLILGDSDGSYDFAALGPLLARLRAGDDLVMGNRFRGGIAPGAMPWKNRWIGNPALSAIGRILFRCPVGDLHCGLRGLGGETFARLDLRTTGMEFASEMVIKATVAGLRIGEVPVVLRRAGRSRPPHLRPWRDGWRHLRFMLLFSPRWLLWYPSLVLALAGFAGVAWLMPSARAVAGITIDIHSLLCAAVAAVIGHLGATLAVCAKAFTIREGLSMASPGLARALAALTFERALAVGLVLAAVGAAGVASSISGWSARSFGPLDPTTTMRVLVPSLMAVLIGAQCLVGGFLLSVLRLPVRREPR